MWVLFPSGRYLMVSVKLQQMWSAFFIESLFASPGVMSASWITTGMPSDAAANTTGTATKPPFENTIDGPICFRSFFACA